MTTLATGEISTGSLWNKNSWHWEEKDYNKVAREFIIKCIEDASSTSEETQIRYHDVVPNGFASISVRKGKKVIVFEFAITLKFSTSNGCGSVFIPEFSNDELDPPCRVSLDSGEERARELVKVKGVSEIKRALASFVEFMNTVETGEDLVEADRKRREAELAEAKKAELEKGSEKLRIAETIKTKEQEALADRKFVEASVWNPNSYHWETRKLDKWAADWIGEQLKLHPFERVSVSGEAENSIRKGKKISLFNLKLSGRYMEKEFQVPCFSNEAGDDDIPKVVFEGEEIIDLSKRLKELVFDQFLSQLKLQ